MWRVHPEFQIITEWNQWITGCQREQLGEIAQGGRETGPDIAATSLRPGVP
jgi:hypothetical protein